MKLSWTDRDNKPETSVPVLIQIWTWIRKHVSWFDNLHWLLHYQLKFRHKWILSCLTRVHGLSKAELCYTAAFKSQHVTDIIIY